MIFTSFLLLLAIEIPTTAPPPDFVAYVEGIRESGLSESAGNDLSGLVIHLTEPETLSFVRDPASGEYSSHYRVSGVFGHAPSAQQLQEMRETNARRTAAVLPTLKGLADKDRSGFVSTAEGRQIRRTIEWGLEAAFILSSETVELAGLCKLTHVTLAEVPAMAAEYERIRQAFKDVPLVKMPALTLPPAQ